MTEADFIIVATAIVVVGVIIVGAIGCEAHWQEERPPHLVTAVTSLVGRASHPRYSRPVAVIPFTRTATEPEVSEPSSFHAVEGPSVMPKVSIAFAVALIAAGLVATATYGRVEPQPPAARISPLQMMTGQHLQQTEMTDMSLVFAR